MELSLTDYIELSRNHRNHLSQNTSGAVRCKAKSTKTIVMSYFWCTPVVVSAFYNHIWLHHQLNACRKSAWAHMKVAQKLWLCVPNSCRHSKAMQQFSFPWHTKTWRWCWWHFTLSFKSLSCVYILSEGNAIISKRSSQGRWRTVFYVSVLFPVYPDGSSLSSIQGRWLQLHQRVIWLRWPPPPPTRTRTHTHTQRSYD